MSVLVSICVSTLIFTNIPGFSSVCVFIAQSYKYRDLTVREITNVISQYKDLKPVMDAYGKSNNTGCLSCILYDCLMLNLLLTLGCSCVSVFNDGSTRDLMSLTGTVPVSYRGKEHYSSFLQKHFLFTNSLHIVPSLNYKVFFISSPPLVCVAAPPHSKDALK